MPQRFEGEASAKELGLDEFTLHFLAAGLQLCDEELGEDATAYQLAPGELDRIKADCAAFQAQCAYELEGMDLSRAGTDYWLTRNGHGAGYWDREEIYGIESARFLTERSTGRPMDLYRGDNGLIYVYPPQL